MIIERGFEPTAGPSRPSATLIHYARQAATSASSTTSSASASGSAVGGYQGNSGGISIPSGTVVGIGLGFVGFAFSTLCCLMAYRAIKISRQAARFRAEGRPNSSFREVWAAEGGVWGFMNGFGESGGVGGGAWAATHITRMRRLEEMFRRERDRAKMLERLRPEWWEVDMAPRGQEKGEEEMLYETVQPLGAIEAHFPDFDKLGPDSLDPPTLAVSVFILMPRPFEEGQTSATEEEELPDVLIGTTELLPMIRASGIPASTSDLDLKASISATEDVQTGHVLPAAAVASNTGEMRRARWAEGEAGMRYVEGLPPAVIRPLNEDD